MVANQPIRTVSTDVAPISNGSTIFSKLSPSITMTNTTTFSTTTPSYPSSTFSSIGQLFTADMNMTNTLSSIGTTSSTKSLAKEKVGKDITKFYGASVTRPPHTFSISPKSAFDSVDSEQQHLNLTRHLNDNSDLESFLQTANLSIRDAHTFLKLVERVSDF